jgi:hypothetical protein
MASMSKWLRDVPLTERQRDVLRRRQLSAGRKGPQRARERRLAREAEIKRRTASEIDRLTERDLFIAGVVAYAAEGTKRKPWQSSMTVKFTNSDPRMILLFLRWLSLVGVDQASLTFRVSIHEDADVDGALRYWSELTGVPSERFKRTTLKRGNRKTPRRGIGEGYRGCLVIGVYKSGDLNKQLDGWFDAVAGQAVGLSPSTASPIQAAVGSSRP